MGVSGPRVATLVDAGETGVVGRDYRLGPLYCTEQWPHLYSRALPAVNPASRIPLASTMQPGPAAWYRMTLTQYIRLVDVQAWMALKSDASRLLLGYLWWVLEPLLYVAVFYVVFDVILDARRADFLVFLMCGKLPFIWFSRSVTQAGGSIVASAGLIGRIDVPKSLFPMAQVQLNFYKQVVVFLFLFAFLWAAGFGPHWNWLWVLPVILVQYLFIVACSLIASILVCYIRDFAMVISLATVFLLFSSGIFWDVRDLGNPEMTQLILAANPVAFLLDAYRQVLMYGLRPDLAHLVSLGVSCCLIIWITILYMRWQSQQLALRALS